MERRVLGRWRDPKCVVRGSAVLPLRRRLVRDVGNVVEWYSTLLEIELAFLQDRLLKRRGGVRVGIGLVAAHKQWVSMGIELRRGPEGR